MAARIGDIATSSNSASGRGGITNCGRAGTAVGRGAPAGWGAPAGTPAGRGARLGGLDVAADDAPAGARALDQLQVHAGLARDLAGERRGLHPAARGGTAPRRRGAGCRRGGRRHRHHRGGGGHGLVALHGRQRAGGGRSRGGRRRGLGRGRRGGAPDGAGFAERGGQARDVLGRVRDHADHLAHRHRPALAPPRSCGAHRRRRPRSRRSPCRSRPPARTSPPLTASPSFFSHLMTLPVSMASDSFGMNTLVIMRCTPAGSRPRSWPSTAS